jgi:8-oxo-dGTP pyrophosphatase MutT (NUDIX family)
MNQTIANLRPKDSATLIILRRNGANTEMLMGKRHTRHSFMPNLYVFPGGAVDVADSRLKLPNSAGTNIPEETQNLLMHHMKGRRTASKARALVLAAIRETFEETGYIIGRKNDQLSKTRSNSWQNFFDTGYLPNCETCKYIGRAITPPNNIRRYDTRFFALWADDLIDGLNRHGTGSDELENLIWVPINDIQVVETPSITKIMVSELKIHIKNQYFKGTTPIPFYHFKHNKMRRDEIIVRE